MAAIEWALEALQVSLYHVINDDTLEEKVRRKEMREITRAMATLEPKSRLYDAEERIRGDRDQLEEQTSGPEMEDAAQLPTEACRATPARGRPRR